MNHPVGNIILINGPSSSGKTTLALAAQKQFDIPFLRFSFDLFLDHHILPLEQIRQGRFSWEALRPSVFTGIHDCVPALARAGNNVLFDHIIESPAWLEQLLQSLSGLDVFLVGLHCSLPELERREIQRGNRRRGEARMDLQSVHRFTSYDLELNSENAVEVYATSLIAAWKNRQRPSAWDKMLQERNPQ
jgi:chloramphenicol 3-O phosphotransferase